MRGNVVLLIVVEATICQALVDATESDGFDMSCEVDGSDVAYAEVDVSLSRPTAVFVEVGHLKFVDPHLAATFACRVVANANHHHTDIAQRRIFEDKSIGELFTEELPVIYPKMNEEELNKEETQEETPVIQDTPVVPEEPKEENKENKELTNTQSIHISNDEIKARLAKLKNLKKEELAPAEKEIPLEQSDTGLINIMSNAGINDDMELPAIKEARNTEEIDTNKTI